MGRVKVTSALAIGALLAAAACSRGGSDDVPRVTPVTLPTISAEPEVFPGHSWQREEQGDWADLDAGLALDGSTCVAVVHDGLLVHDAYWNGGAERSGRRAYSITKSLTSLLVGMQVDDGTLDLDDSASKQVDEWRTGAAQEVTARDLLSMTSGRRWDEAADRRMIRVETDQTSFAVRAAQGRAPGKNWVYDNAAAQALESVLDDVAEGDDVVGMAQDRLLEPLGMRDTTWGRDAAGNALTYSGIESTCLDLARVGHLMLHEGEWDGQRIVSPDFVAEATRPSSRLNAAYGLMWWVNGQGRVVEVLRQAGFTQDKPAYEGRLAPNVPADAFWAFGYGNQYIAVVPSAGVVAVRLGARPATPDRITFDTFTAGVLDALATS
ncbi:serine hydrolase [Aeromicrobium sp. A1-2]|uniref:serine hydrolase domain-containing protein n=1 Tax=Aeromicrobium sp. A1-2 TaxID=2107713 RepID=UPI0013C2D410|nr:serine hydrolase domain-containing protein [Aeromicrobium sp. A1-2]